MKKNFKKNDIAYLMKNINLSFKKGNELVLFELHKGDEVNILKYTNINLEETKYGVFIETCINDEILKSTEPLPQTYLYNCSEWSVVQKEELFLEQIKNLKTTIANKISESDMDKIINYLQNNNLLQQLEYSTVSKILNTIEGKITDMTLIDIEFFIDKLIDESLPF